jgi:hypothetical protein
MTTGKSADHSTPESAARPVAGTATTPATTSAAASATESVAATTPASTPESGSASDSGPISVAGPISGSEPASDVVSARPKLGAQLIGLLLDIAAPIGLFYLLRGVGVDAYLALLAGAVAPAATTVVGLLRRRRIDGIGLSMVALILLSALVSLLTASPRFLLVRDGWLTGAWAIWFLASLLTRRPVAFAFARPLLEGRRAFDRTTHRWVRPTTRSWDALWDDLPGFRRAWQVCTAIWGAAMLLDAVLRIVMAYTLPVDVVPGLGGALWPVTFVLLQVVTNVYFYRVDLWGVLIDRSRSGGSSAPLIKGSAS